MIRSSMPMPIRFGGVPIGVPMPPIEAPNAAINIIAVAKFRLAGCDSRPCVRCATIDRPIGNIIAVVAVLLIHIEMPVATAPKTNRIRVGLPPTARDDRAPNAIRRSRPCANIASASMKLPMNRKMIGSAKGARTVRAGADLKNHREHRADQRRHRERQRLGHPQHHHHRQDGRETMRRRGQRQRREQHGNQQQRAANQSHRAAAAVEQLFGGGIGLTGLDGSVEAAPYAFIQWHSAITSAHPVR